MTQNQTVISLSVEHGRLAASVNAWIKANWKFFIKVWMHRELHTGQLAKKGTISWEVPSDGKGGHLQSHLRIFGPI